MSYEIAAKFTSSTYTTVRDLVVAGELKVIRLAKADVVDREEVIEYWLKHAELWQRDESKVREKAA